LGSLLALPTRLVAVVVGAQTELVVLVVSVEEGKEPIHLLLQQLLEQLILVVVVVVVTAHGLALRVALVLFMFGTGLNKERDVPIFCKA
jgi:hypothetical protein